MVDLIERLHAYIAQREKIRDGGDTVTECNGEPLTLTDLREAADALEAAREDAERYQWLRDSKACSLSVSFNDHHSMYQSVTDTLDEPHGYYSDISDSVRATMIKTDTIWTIHIYPNSPVGFNVYHAATLDAAIDAARKETRNG